MNSEASRVKLAYLKDYYRSELFSFLEDCEGNKVSKICTSTLLYR